MSEPDHGVQIARLDERVRAIDEREQAHHEDHGDRLVAIESTAKWFSRTIGAVLIMAVLGLILGVPLP